MKKLLSLAAALGALLTIHTSAHAFCGFYVGGAGADLYNKATLVVLMRDGTRTILSMQNSYEGPPENFAMVVPVPVVLQQEDVQTLPPELFAKIDRLAAPRLVEYWEQDPCRPPIQYEMAVRGSMIPQAASAEGAGGGDLGVRIEAQFAVAEYDIVVLSASDSSGLDTWLRREGYHIPSGAEPILRPYVEQGTKFFVARVDTSRIARWENGRAMLSPLRVQYDSEQFSLPVRLGLANSAGTQDLIVHILARGQRYDVANYDNVTIPTNIRVTDAVRDRFGAFYTALFDRALQDHPNAVVTEYSWDAGSCDPCPGPTLDPSDLATLGLDTIGGPAYNFTLTRLHYRYTADTLGDDLVFRQAPALIGGRGVPDANGVLTREIEVSTVNNFQGRYAILHPWEAAITCDQPVRGQWGGPPSGGNTPTTSATNLAFAPRGSDLSTFVAEDVSDLAMQSSEATMPNAGPQSHGEGSPGGSGEDAAVHPTSSGCASCAVAHPRDRSGPIAALLGLGLVTLWRRRVRAMSRAH